MPVLQFVLPPSWLLSVPKTPQKFRVASLSSEELKIFFAPGGKRENPFQQESYRLETRPVALNGKRILLKGEADGEGAELPWRRLGVLEYGEEESFTIDSLPEGYSAE